MKNVIKALVGTAGVVVMAFTISACSPEVGSKEWCEDMKEKPKGDWTPNELTDFTKHCVL
ncbi:DUF3012 domain-containing protein [Sneathiella chinensis]|nr:DUF3012 domain-containing protein [Sneathiella chinensis]